MNRIYQWLLLTMVITFFSSCVQPEIKVALLTKLEAGSIIGTSEIAAVKEFERTHPNSRIHVIPFDDGWDPVRTKQAYGEVQRNNIQFLITSHTSTCATEIISDINRDKRLTIVTGATTTQLSKKDDYILRIIPDATQEQTAIAAKIAELAPKNILIIRDLSNPGYVIPAQEAVISELRRLVNTVKIKTYDIDANKIDITGLAPVMTDASYEVLYVLIGGYRNIAGNIAQYFYTFHPEATIFFTPWMNNKELINTAGPAISKSILPSLFPSRKESPNIEAYMSSIETNLHLSPTIISLKVYQALELLDLAFRARAANPEKAKTWLLSQKTIETRLGSITFDAFGDSSAGYYFITDIPGEFN
ncbi:ABC transporter substrate-binding protein [Gracilinema caldarium]|uniref:ABC transporter substrate-binding protein n=1 Tax=Gracilinema caldarium TaxID=215591 RepID=UPI0026F04CB3|nr:ABC transporter substrate-binding protein [Gracilinema caldarium]